MSKVLTAGVSLLVGFGAGLAVMDRITSASLKNYEAVTLNLEQQVIDREDLLVYNRLQCQQLIKSTGEACEQYCDLRNKE